MYMKIEYFKEYSHVLGRDMEYKVYGHAGKPCLAFPTQNGRFYELEDRGLIGSIASYIEAGRIQVFCVDGIDCESFSATWKSTKDRIEAQERYYNYIINELVYRIYDINAYGNGGNYASGLMTMGCSLGAYQALNFFLRRPDIFNNVIGLSGVYHSGFFFQDYADELTFLNSPLDTLRCMDQAHHYLDLYRKSNIILCVGSGAYELESISETKAMEYELSRHHIPAWVDYWGSDMMHDWPAWVKQLPYFLQYVV